VLGKEPSPADLKMESVTDVIRAAGRCRVVVTGSYHAAVFALAQGKSAVCIARSSYYAGKFQGLRNQFGDGCQVVSLECARGPELLSDAIRSAWSRADEVRPDLLQAAQEQIARSWFAHAVMAAELMDRRWRGPAPARQEARARGGEMKNISLSPAHTAVLPSVGSEAR
jgi:colanic acid/amylovoran biosynthesis protein